jgi:hypothetical protein
MLIFFKISCPQCQKFQKLCCYLCGHFKIFLFQVYIAKSLKLLKILVVTAKVKK